MWCECFDEIYVKEIKRKINLQTSGILCRILGWQCDGRQWNRQNITAWHHEIWIVHWTKCVCRSSTFAWRWTYAAMINMSIVSFSHFNFVLFLWVSVDVDSFVPGIRAYTHTHTHPLKSINHLEMKSHFTNTDNGKKGTSHKKCFISLVLFFYYTLTRALSFFKFSFWIDGNLFIKCTSSLSSHVITVEIIDYYRVNSLIYNYCAHLIVFRSIISQVWPCCLFSFHYIAHRDTMQTEDYIEQCIYYSYTIEMRFARFSFFFDSFLRCIRYPSV